jgi:murein DD-endopeptidase MepM/ murein hydrolase activator NlpD
MRRKSKTTGHRTSSIEPLESRYLLANIHLVDAYLVDASGNKLASVAVGQQPFVQVEFTTTGLAAGAHYDVRTSTSGRTFTSTIDWGAGGAGTGFWIFRSPQMLVRPGLQSVSVSLDVNTDVTETDEGDNTHLHLYSGVTFASGFYKPLEGTQNFDWSVGNYNDTDANYPDDGFFGGVCEDFNGGDYCYDGHNGWDIGVANWRLGYQGWDIYAAAGGTVQIANDGNDDHNTEALGQPSNYVQIDHGGGWMTQYHHMAKNTITVIPGQVITNAQAAAGFKIGEMGSSGNSTGLHLHWGVYYNGQLVEPMTDKTNYLNFTLAYTPDAPAILGTGVTTYDPSAELGEGPSDASVFLSNTAGQTVYTWATLSGLEPSDTFGPVVRRPDNSIAYNGGAAFTGANHGGAWYATYGLPSNAAEGAWRIDWVINGITERSAFFDVVDTGRPQARIYRGSEYIVDGRRSPLDFGTLIQNQTTAPSMTFTVRNSGQEPLTTGGLVIPAGFSLAAGSSLAASIAPGGSDAFTIVANITTVGHKEGFVSFVTNDVSPNELIESFAIEADVMSASDAINSLLTSEADSVFIRRENGFSNAQIWVNSSAVTPTWEIPISQMANLSINTLGGEDILTVDFLYGSPLNLTGMTYNGGSAADQLSIWGSDNVDSILFAEDQAWLGLSRVDYVSVEDMRGDGRDGDDTITVGGAGLRDLDQSGTNITVTGGDGNDDLVLNDQDDLGSDTYTLTSTTFDKTGFTLLTYSTIEGVTLNASDDVSNGNVINIDSTLQTAPCTVNAGDGNDLIRITPTSGHLEMPKAFARSTAARAMTRWSSTMRTT